MDTEILSPLPGIEPGPLASEASEPTTELPRSIYRVYATLMFN